MSAFEDLLSAVRALVDPATGVASTFKGHLQATLSQRSDEVKKHLAMLNAIDETFVTELQEFIDNTEPDNAALLKLIALTESYLTLTNRLYDSLFHLKYGKTGNTLMKQTRDAILKIHDMLTGADTANISAKEILREEEVNVIPPPGDYGYPLEFSGTIGGPNPTIKSIHLQNPLDSDNYHWLVTPDELYEDAPGNWLMVMPTEGDQSKATIYVAALLVEDMEPTTYHGTFAIHISSEYPEGTVNLRSGDIHTQYCQVTFNVQEPCTILGSTDPDLNFDIAKGQKATSTLTITSNGTCDHDLFWTASSTAQWLTFDPNTPSNGIVGSGPPAQSVIVVDSTNLEEGTYTGAIILTAVDSIDNQPVSITNQPGTIQVILAKLSVKPTCSLGVPTSQCLNFSAEVGVIPAPQKFQIGIDGDCVDSVTITTDTQGNKWLNATASPATIVGKGTSTITVSIVSAQPLPGSYDGTIKIIATKRDGTPIQGSPQYVKVSLNIIAAPALLVSPSSGLEFTISSGKAKQSLKIINTGGEPLIWNATLDPNTPSGLVTLPITTGTIQGGDNQDIDVAVDATGVTDNKTYHTNVTISATDASAIGNSVAGSPAKVPITISVTPQNQFLGVMKQFYPPDPHTGKDQLVVLQTERLFKRRSLKMSDSQLEQLTNSWTPVVTFIADPSTDKKITKILQMDKSTLTELINLNSLLDQLYDRVETVERTDVDIFSIE